MSTTEALLRPSQESGHPEERPVTVRVPHVRHRTTRAKIVIFAILAALVVLVAIFAEYLCPYDPYAQDLMSALQAPSTVHLLGTDNYGRDLLSRVIMGAQSSIFSTLALVLMISIVGSALGILAGWKGGILDTVIMRIADLFLSFPGLVFALAIAGILGGGIQNAVIALAVISWPKYARIARSQTLEQKNSTYISAAKMAGDDTAQLIRRHILPNILGPILVTALLDIGTMMMELAGLSFLGLGAQPPMAEWGSMMSSGTTMLQIAPWVILAPGVAIFITVLIFNLLGDTARDFLDPKQRAEVEKAGKKTTRRDRI